MCTPRAITSASTHLRTAFPTASSRGERRLRDKFSATLGDAPYLGVLNALAIGDQSSIPPAQWQVFTRTGVNHLMSISGLHITMLASLGFALTYWMWRRSVRLVLLLPARKAAALAAMLAALIYALLSVFAVPAQRTVYMVAAVAAALWLNRNFSLAQILCFALLGYWCPTLGDHLARLLALVRRGGTDHVCVPHTGSVPVNPQRNPPLLLDTHRLGAPIGCRNMPTCNGR